MKMPLPTTQGRGSGTRWIGANGANRWSARWHYGFEAIGEQALGLLNFIWIGQIVEKMCQTEDLLNENRSSRSIVAMVQLAGYLPKSVYVARAEAFDEIAGRLKIKAPKLLRR